MASVQYGSIITGMKGNIGGQTFQNGNVAKVLRNKGYRKGTTSQTRQIQLTSLATVTSSWRAVGINNQGLWRASTGNWPFKDKFGNTYYGSGYQKYVAQNIALINLGFPIVVAPDTPLSADAPGTFSTAFTVGGSLLINWANTPTQDQFIQVFCSAPLSAGRNGKHVKLVAVGLFNMIGVTSCDITSNYEGFFGAPPAGCGISVKVQVRTQQFPIIQFPTTLLAEL
ncbi:MAG TPA: hypothetical protein VMR41_02990 [Patescibacteria group bacterium]|nr:hypothetical protein [Patescibacteria group bacterium]